MLPVVCWLLIIKKDSGEVKHKEYIPITAKSITKYKNRTWNLMELQATIELSTTHTIITNIEGPFGNSV